MAKIYWVDPEKIFVKGLPFSPLHHPKDYSDRTSIGLVHYLEVLPSIALYGFKYVVTVDTALRVADGDYRVFVGRELGIKVPIIILPYLDKFFWKVAFHIVKKIRRIARQGSLFYRMRKNPDFKYGKVKLICKFQKNILYDPDLLQRTLEADKRVFNKKIAIQASKRRLYYLLIHKIL